VGRIHLGSILGTTITLDFSFLIVIALFVMSDIEVVGWRYALLWVPVVFISILIHELAHAATIGSFGYGPSHILLQGIGGVTVNERRSKPWHDVFISAAGPLSSFLLAWGVGMLMLRVPIASRDPFLAALLPLLRIANIYWAFFNLVPVAPLDGYGVVRNLLRIFLDERLAFTIAIWISIIVGSALAIVGLIFRQYFVALLVLWYVRGSYLQWQFFRSIDHTND
jgi:stage IV sporulation protein FB